MCVGQSKKGLLAPSGEKPGTLVRQSIHRLKPEKMSKSVKDLRCNLKSSIAQRDTLDFYIYHIDFGCVIGILIDSGLVAHWHLH